MPQLRRPGNISGRKLVTGKIWNTKAETGKGEIHAENNPESKQGGPMINNAKKAVIHIAKAQTGMSEEEYLDLLGSVGAASSKNLNNKTFSIVMGQFEQLGFKTKSKTRSKRKVNNLPNRKKPLMKKLEAIILDMNKSWAYVDAIAKKRFSVDTVQWLEVPELRKLVQMMIIYQKRQQKRMEKMIR